MILYRANENLLYNGKRIPKGAVHPLTKLSDHSISLLLQKERITMYRAPPLDQLPNFLYRARHLGKFGIDATELYGLSVNELNAKTGLDKVLLARWKHDLCIDLGIEENVIKSG